MSAPSFVVDAALLQPGVQTVVVSGAEGHHAARARRVEVGESIQLMDGRGTLAAASVVRVDRDEVECAVGSIRTESRPAPRVVVVQALPKGDRGELAVEMMTEVGVDVVVPWAASRCIARWRGDRATKAVARWRTSAREAAKQAGRAWLLDVTALATTPEVSSRLTAAALPVVLDRGGDRRLAELPVPADGDLVIVVGPEGGITDDELAAFSAAGAHVCRLGPGVLRTSTAGVVAAGVLLAASPRW